MALGVTAFLLDLNIPEEKALSVRLRKTPNARIDGVSNEGVE